MNLRFNHIYLQHSSMSPSNFVENSKLFVNEDVRDPYFHELEENQHDLTLAEITTDAFPSKQEHIAVVHQQDMNSNVNND
jgi:hypothetical protein